MWFTLLGSLAAAAETVPTTGLAWRWEPADDHAWYVESAVSLPQFIWFYAHRVDEARVTAWHLRMVIRCDDVHPLGRTSWSVGCTVADVGLRAAVMPGDAGRDLLPPILAEVDEGLTGAVLRFRLTPEGRIGRFVVEGLPRATRQDGQMNENLRLVLLRAMAGFDLGLPRGGGAGEGFWTQDDSAFFEMPGVIGTVGRASAVHAVMRRDGAVAEITSVGRGVIGMPSQSSDTPADNYLTELDAQARFDVEEGLLVERSWAVEGTATAGSLAAEGGDPVPYLQRGYLRVIAPDEPRPDVGPTEEMVAEHTPSIFDVKPDEP